MARTTIAITSVASALRGGTLIGTAGDTVNDNQIFDGNVNRLHMLVSNRDATGANAFQFVIPATQANWYRTDTLLGHTVPIASGGVESVRMVVLDTPFLRQPDGYIYINMTSGNADQLTFYAFDWAPTITP